MYASPFLTSLAPAWHDWPAVCDRAATTAVRLLAGEGEGK